GGGGRRPVPRLRVGRRPHHRAVAGRAGGDRSAVTHAGRGRGSPAGVGRRSSRPGLRGSAFPGSGRGSRLRPSILMRRGRRAAMLRHISVTVNGTRHEADVEPRQLLVYFIREALGLTGTNVGCHTSTCGACTVLVNGQSVKSWTMLPVHGEGRQITTIQGPDADGAGGPLPAVS